MRARGRGWLTKYSYYSRKVALCDETWVSGDLSCPESYPGGVVSTFVYFKCPILFLADVAFLFSPTDPNP